MKKGRKKAEKKEIGRRQCKAKKKDQKKKEALVSPLQNGARHTRNSYHYAPAITHLIVNRPHDHTLSSSSSSTTSFCLPNHSFSSFPANVANTFFIVNFCPIVVTFLFPRSKPTRSNLFFFFLCSCVLLYPPFFFALSFFSLQFPFDPLSPPPPPPPRCSLLFGPAFLSVYLKLKLPS